MNIGVCGIGTIASWTSDIINRLGDPNIALYACATAPGFGCTEFAAKYGWKKVCASYEELMGDPDVDLVYIAVPSTFHYTLCRQALNAGKAVLAEKPFAVNDVEAAELVALAKKNGLFLCEALWPSFLPVRRAIDEEIAAGTIGIGEVTGGNIVMLDNVLLLDRVKSLELGGGSLLDGAPYALGFMADHFGVAWKWSPFRRRCASSRSAWTPRTTSPSPIAMASTSTFDRSWIYPENSTRSMRKSPVRKGKFGWAACPPPAAAVC